MTMRISPITAQLGRLSIGGAASSSSSSSSSSSRTGATRLVHTVKRKKGGRVEPSFAPGHGEKIFIFNHFRDGMTVYSHGPIIKPNQAFQQIPFNGKKLRPAKIRKDYWRPMAMIQFPEGQGEVGRSVYQRLRECKKLHEYSWGDEVLYGENGQTLTTRQRGRRLNDQRANTIADMAAVLGGLGKGNKIVVEGAPAAATPAHAPTPTPISTPAPAPASAEAEAETKPASGETGGEKEAVAQEPLPVTVDGGKALVRATVWWADANEKNYAKRWTSNVTHELFEEAILVPKDEVVPEAAPLASQAAAAEAVESTAPPPPPPPPNTA